MRATVHVRHNFCSSLTELKKIHLYGFSWPHDVWILGVGLMIALVYRLKKKMMWSVHMFIREIEVSKLYYSSSLRSIFRSHFCLFLFLGAEIENLFFFFSSYVCMYELLSFHPLHIDLKNDGALRSNYWWLGMYEIICLHEDILGM